MAIDAIQPVTPQDLSLWCDNLRSGTYLQGHHKLFQPEYSRYCCLGVLNEQKNPGISQRYVKKHIPAFIRDESSDIKYLSYGTQKALAHLNDITKLSFTQIADTIEYFAVDILDDTFEDVFNDPDDRIDI